MGIIGEVKISADFADLHPLEMPLGISFLEVPRMCVEHRPWRQTLTERGMLCAMRDYFQLNPIANFKSGSLWARPNLNSKKSLFPCFSSVSIPPMAFKEPPVSLSSL
jgi:hypothetical protein